MTIPGTVTRLVKGEGGASDRVFMRPTDPTVLRKLDGSQYLASGEIAFPSKLDGLTVGDATECEVKAPGEDNA